MTAVTELSVCRTGLICDDPPPSPRVSTPEPNVTTVTSFTPPEKPRKSRAKPLEEHTDPRDAKMVTFLGGGRYVAYYYAGKKKRCLGEDFLTFEAAVLARRHAAQQFKPHKQQKLAAKKRRLAERGGPTMPCLDKHHALLELLAARLVPHGLEVRLAAKRASFWDEPTSLFVRPTERAPNDDRFVALKVKHCGKVVQGGVRFKDLNKVTANHLLCVYANNETPGQIQRSWLFPTNEIGHYACLYMGMSDGCLKANRWQRPPYAMRDVAQLAATLRALPRDVTLPSE